MNGWSVSKSRRSGLFATACLALFPGPGGSVDARALPEVEGAPICMSKEDPGEPLPLRIVLPTHDVEAMRAIGFEEISCAEAFASTEEILEWREKACAMASNPDERLQELIETKFGARPAVFCGMAELAIGQWRQPLSQGN